MWRHRRGERTVLCPCQDIQMFQSKWVVLVSSYKYILWSPDVQKNSTSIWIVVNHLYFRSSCAPWGNSLTVRWSSSLISMGLNSSKQINANSVYLRWASNKFNFPSYIKSVICSGLIVVSSASQESQQEVHTM